MKKFLSVGFVFGLVWLGPTAYAELDCNTVFFDKVNVFADKNPADDIKSGACKILQVQRDITDKVMDAVNG